MSDADKILELVAKTIKAPAGFRSFTLICEDGKPMMVIDQSDTEDQVVYVESVNGALVKRLIV